MMSGEEYVPESSTSPRSNTIAAKICRLSTQKIACWVNFWKNFACDGRVQT
jgi:hypothetical protein